MLNLQCPTPNEMIALKKKYFIFNSIWRLVFFMGTVGFGGFLYFHGPVSEGVFVSVVFMTWIFLFFGYQSNPCRLLYVSEVIAVRDEYLQFPEVSQYIKTVNGYGRQLYAVDMNRFESFKRKVESMKAKALFEEAEKEIYSVT